MGKKTPPFEPYPKWTTAKFFGWIRAILRQGYTRWPPKFKVLQEAKRVKPPDKRGRHKWEYKCAVCGRYKPATQTQVDHIVPCGSLKDWDDIPSFAERLFVGEDGLQVICSTCHKKKTKQDREDIANAKAKD